GLQNLGEPNRPGGRAALPGALPLPNVASGQSAEHLRVRIRRRRGRRLRTPPRHSRSRRRMRNGPHSGGAGAPPLFTLSGPFSVGMIWAESANGVIGAEGTLAWHIPEDLAHFRRVGKTRRGGGAARAEERVHREKE